MADLVGEIAWRIAALALIAPYAAVSFRRLHDVNRSGWWFWMPPAAATFGDILVWRYGGAVSLVSMLLAIASFAVMVYWLALPGDAEANRFGEPPIPVED